VDREVVFTTPPCRCEIWTLYRKRVQLLEKDAPEEFLALLRMGERDRLCSKSILQLAECITTGV